MSRTLLLPVIFLAISSTTLSHGCKTRTPSLIQIPKIRNLDNAIVAKSVRNETSVIYIVVASKKKDSILDRIIEMYAHLAPITVQELPKKHWPQSGGLHLGWNYVGIVLGIYDTTAQINVNELESAFGRSWSTRACIVLWVLETVDRSLDEVFEDFWAHDVLNVDLVVQDSSSGRWEVFTYNPFVTTDNGARGSIERLESDARELFPDKLANMYNYSIPISVFYQYPTTIMTSDFRNLGFGPDTKLLRAISREMNFNIDLKTYSNISVNYVTTVGNNERVGIMGDIINGRSDVVWNRQYADDYPAEYTEITYPYHTTKSCIFVRKAPQVPMMFRVLLSFRWATWWVVFIALGVMVIIMILAKEKDIFLRVIHFLLFQNLGVIPTRNHIRVHNIFFIIWSIFMVNFYNANLMEDFLFPKYFVELDTSDDLYQIKNFTLYVGYSMFTVVHNSGIQTWHRFADRTVVEFNFEHCLDRVVAGEPVACAVSELVAGHALIYEKWISQSGPQLHKIKEYLSDHSEAFMVKRGSPYLFKFDHLIIKLMEVGLYKKWSMDVTHTRAFLHEQLSMCTHKELKNVKHGKIRN